MTENGLLRLSVVVAVFDCYRQRRCPRTSAAAPAAATDTVAAPAPAPATAASSSVGSVGFDASVGRAAVPSTRRLRRCRCRRRCCRDR